MIKVCIIGAGNVAQHLWQAFDVSTQVSVTQLFSRSSITSEDFGRTEVVHELDLINEADVYIIAVSDDAIGAVSASLPFRDRLVVHTAGSVAMDTLSDNNRKGVLYPLQTFSKNRPVDFSSIPICLEAEYSKDLLLLEDLSRSISEKTYHISSDQRKILHLAAVFVNNFTNHLYGIAEAICAAHHVPFETLQPLIEETAKKMQSMSPKEAQTGPAKRKDTETIQKHLDLLSDVSHKAIYQQLTDAIQEQHGRKKL